MVKTKSFQEQDKDALPLLLNTLLEGLPRAVSQERELKGVQTGKKEAKFSLLVKKKLSYI